MFPRWLSWLVLGLMGYLLISGASHREKKPVQPVLQTETETTPAQPASYPHVSAAADLDRWKRTVNPDYAAATQCDYTPKAAGLGLKIIEDVEGTGGAAKCGDAITVALTVWNGKGAALYSGEVALSLGTQQVALGLDNGLIGLRPSGTRTLILPPDALTRAKKTDAPPALLTALKPGSVSIVTVTRFVD